MLRKLRVLFVIAATCLTLAALRGVETAAACSEQQLIRTYYSDSSFTNAVGEGQTSCRSGSFVMCWGYQTSYYTNDYWYCGSCGQACSP